MPRKMRLLLGVEFECNGCGELFIHETEDPIFLFTKYNTPFFWITECCGESAHYRGLYLLEPQTFEIINK